MCNPRHRKFAICMRIAVYMQQWASCIVLFFLRTFLDHALFPYQQVDTIDRYAMHSFIKLAPHQIATPLLPTHLFCCNCTLICSLHYCNTSGALAAYFQHTSLCMFQYMLHTRIGYGQLPAYLVFDSLMQPVVVIYQNFVHRQDLALELCAHTSSPPQILLQ